MLRKLADNANGADGVRMYAKWRENVWEMARECIGNGARMYGKWRDNV